MTCQVRQRKISFENVRSTPYTLLLYPEPEARVSGPEAEVWGAGQARVSGPSGRLFAGLQYTDVQVGIRLGCLYQMLAARVYL